MGEQALVVRQHSFFPQMCLILKIYSLTVETDLYRLFYFSICLILDLLILDRRTATSNHLAFHPSELLVL